MSKQPRRSLFWRIFWWIGLLSYPLLTFSPLFAQEQTLSAGELVKGVDCQAAFPTCTIMLFHPQLGDLVANETVKLSADGAPLPLTSVEARTQPLQVMFVLDAPAVIRQNNIDNQFADATLRLLEWFQRDPAAPNKADVLNSDWWSAYLIGATTEADFTPITPWQQGDYGGFTNGVRTSIDALPAGGPASTALVAPLRAALDAFQDEAAVKVLILFSDGFDRTQNNVADVVQTAREKGIRIHTVLHWPGGGAVAATNLRTLATETGGQFVDSTAPEALNAIWQALEQEQTLGVATFALPPTFPQQLTVSAQLADGQGVAETVAFPAPTLPPLQLDSITVNGASGAILTLQPDAAVMEIALGITIPSGGGEINQRIGQVTYTFGEANFVDAEPPFDQYTLSLEGLALGESPRALVVQITDRYGPAVTSAPINISRQPLPTPTPTPLPPPTDTALPPPTLASVVTEAPTIASVQPVNTPAAQPLVALPPALAGSLQQLGLDPNSPWLLAGGASLLLLIPVGLVLAVVLRRRRQPNVYDVMAESVSVWADPDATQPADLDDATNPAIEIFARATLVLERGGSELPKEIHLHTQQINGELKNEWKIGRSYAYSNYVIEDRDKRVSRWHATIFERNAQFFIRDEGSAGGTYVNRAKVEPRQETPLANNDVINFNTVAYRFTIGDGPGGTATSPYTDPDATEVTESLS